MMDGHPVLVKEVLSFGWLHDEISNAKWRALVNIRDLARKDSALALQVIREPFMQPPFLQRDQYALSALNIWSRPGYDEGSDLLAELANQSWFNDGLDEPEAALLHAIRNSGDFRQALIKTPYVASTAITLPFTGDMGLAVVRHTPFPPDDHTLATLEEAVRVIEDFMGAPFPVGDVILLIVEPEFWKGESKGQLSRFIQHSGSAPDAYVSAIIYAKNSGSGPLKETLYHEIAHHYLLVGHKWLDEGIAEFLEAYVIAQTGGTKFEGRLAYLESSSSRCDRENIWQHLNYYGSGRCNYYLGAKFMLAMYDVLGKEGLSAALRDLYNKSLFHTSPNPEFVYYAFLSNVPHGKEEAFQTAYRHYHGGPIADRVPAESPEFSPLVAFYDSTNGDYWAYNGNWVSNAPLGAWHGVSIDREGRVRSLKLLHNSLVGEIPSELEGLSSLISLKLSHNQLTGEIPPDLGNLNQLQELQLVYNQLSGEIPPELGNLTNLKRLRLSYNQLTGEIPPELGNLTSLQTLFLQGNQFTGCIPEGLRDTPTNDLHRLRLPFCDTLEPVATP